MKDEAVNDFAKSLLSVKRDLTYCSVCGNITEDDPARYVQIQRETVHVCS